MSEQQQTQPHPANNSEVVVDKDIVFNYDLSAAPKGQKVIVLTKGNIALMGVVTGRKDRDKDLKGWHALPCRNKELEERLGLLNP